MNSQRKRHIVKSGSMTHLWSLECTAFLVCTLFLNAFLFTNPATLQTLSFWVFMEASLHRHG